VCVVAQAMPWVSVHSRTMSYVFQPVMLHEVIGGAASRQPLVPRRNAESGAVHVLDAGLLAPLAEHDADPGVDHVHALWPLMAEPQPRGR